MSLVDEPAGQCEPTAQLVHQTALDAPVCALYVPAAHAVHDVASEPTSGLS